LLAHPNRARGIQLLREFNLVEPILPELAAGGDERWERGTRVVEHLPAQLTFPLAFAALLHTLDKPTVEQIADRLRLSGAEKTRTAWLVEHQRSLDDAPTLPLSKLKTLLVQPGIEELLALHRARALASGSSLAAVEHCEAMLRDTPPDVLNPPPLLTGEDLIAMGLNPGPEFKRILDAVREAQLGGQVKTPQDASRLVKEIIVCSQPATQERGKDDKPG
jgi:poly(A) polymerase